MSIHSICRLLGILLIGLTGWSLSITELPGLAPLAFQSGGANCEGPSEGSQHSQDARPTFSIVISASQAVVKVGSPVSLQVTKTNESDHEINNSTVRSFSGPYEIDVKDNQCNVRPETKESRRAKESTNSNPRAEQSAIFKVLKPGEAEHDRIDVDRYIDLNQPGKYTIKLRQFDAETKTIVKSNTIAVTLIP
jgi:hypothetical protein